MVVDKAGAAVTALAEALKTPAEHVYAVLVRQATLEGAMCLVCVLAWWGAAAALLGLARFAWQRYGLHRQAQQKANSGSAALDAEGALAATWVLGIVGGLCLFVSFFFLWDGILQLANTEYYALRRLVAAF